MAQSKSPKPQEGLQNTVVLLSAATLVAAGNAADVPTLSRVLHPYITCWVFQGHATLNAVVQIEASPQFDNFMNGDGWVPIARLSVDTSVDPASRSAVVTLPPGAYNYLRARVISETGSGATATVVITSHTQFAT